MNQVNSRNIKKDKTMWKIVLLLCGSIIIGQKGFTKDEERNINITKAKIKWLKKNKLGEALDFYKNSKNNIRDIYHHVGIYSFKIESLSKFVSIPPSLNELKFKLEQWRALDSSLSIGVSYVKNVPISIDTKEDLISVESIIKTQND